MISEEEATSVGLCGVLILYLGGHARRIKEVQRSKNRGVIVSM